MLVGLERLFVLPWPTTSSFAVAGRGYLIQMGQRLIDGLEVLLHNGLTALAIGLLDALLDLRYRLLSRQDTAERKETGLHDRVDAASHAQCHVPLYARRSHRNEAAFARSPCCTSMGR